MVKNLMLQMHISGEGIPVLVSPCEDHLVLVMRCGQRSLCPR